MDNIKIMSINDNVALVYDYNTGDTNLVRCDCYFETKYKGYITEHEILWLDSERGIVDMGNGLFVLNFGGTILECLSSDKNTVSEVIKKFFDGDPAKAIIEFDRIFIDIFGVKAQTEVVRRFLNEYGDRVIVYDDGSVEIDGLYLIDSRQNAGKFIGRDDNGAKVWHYLCVQPIGKPVGYHAVINGKEVEINAETVLTLVKAWYLLNRHLYVGDSIYVNQIKGIKHLRDDLIRRAELHGQEIPKSLRETR